MAVALHLLLGLALALGARTQHVSLDPRLDERAKEYFQSLEAGDFGRIWDLSSPRVHEADGGSREDFAAHLREVALYDVRTELLGGVSHENDGFVYVRIRTLATRGGTWQEAVYESRWVKLEDEWYLEKLDEYPEWDDADLDKLAPAR